jgi:hypothetical protein
LGVDEFQLWPEIAGDRRGEHLSYLLRAERIDLLPLAAMRFRPEIDHRRGGGLASLTRATRAAVIQKIARPF